VIIFGLTPVKTAVLTDTSTPVPEPASIISQPVDQYALPGQDVTFTIFADGNPNPSYQWYYKHSLFFL
jgi:hypothetical protein